MSITKNALSQSFPHWPEWGKKEEENLIRAMDDGQWGTLGKQAVAFSRRFADFLHVPYTIAINNGVQALELLLRGCGIGRGDEVILPAYAPLSLLSAVAYVGAYPVLCDVDEKTGCLDAKGVQALITQNTRAILALHPFGRPCDMDALAQTAKDNSLLLLEECTYATGSQWKGTPCGALGDGSAFGFDMEQVLTGGDGGIIATSSEEIRLHAWHYHNSGRAPWNQDNQSLNGKTFMGSNGRMAEWEAAVLDAQMDKLEEACRIRFEKQKMLKDTLKDLPGILLPPEDERITMESGSFFAFRFTGNRDAFIAALQAEGIPCKKGFAPLPFEKMANAPAFEKSTGRAFMPPASLPNAECFWRETVLLPGHLFLADEQALSEMAKIIRKAVLSFQ